MTQPSATLEPPAGPPGETGADRLCAALLAEGVDTCFANPGTSEMHVVAALDRQPRIRCILGLAEGVVTGAADGYGRMADAPAATLLHCGPGLANGLANLHNAQRARTPVLNVIGDHSTRHLGLDAPLTSDIESLAAPMSAWLHRLTPQDDLPATVARAVRHSRRDGVASLILPADVAWQAHSPAEIRPTAPAPRFRAHDPDRLREALAALRSGREVALILSGTALRAAGLADAERLRRATGCRIMAQGANGRIERGGSRAFVPRMSFQSQPGREQLAGAEVVVLIGAQEPVTFFGYPGQRGRLVPEGAEVIELAGPGSDPQLALAMLADSLGRPERHATPPPPARPDPADFAPGAALSVAAIDAIVAARLPEGAILCDEVITSAGIFEATAMAAPHDYLQLTGGAIGTGIPMCIGAAVAAPGRRVIGMQADGSGLYTLQGLWTQARERLDVVTVILSNRSYAILRGEMRKMGIAEPGANARRMLDLDDPAVDWVALSRSLGVAAERAETVGRFDSLFADALRQPGPMLIEARL
jgi:acetolactate synthase I/II/III large subunit